MTLKREFGIWVHRLIGHLSGQCGHGLRYGKHLLTLGKWKVTTKGILFERNQFGECDYFMDESHLMEMEYILTELDRLLRTGWLTKMDCYQFTSAWYQKITMKGKEPIHPRLIDQSVRILHHYLSNTFVKAQYTRVRETIS